MWLSGAYTDYGPSDKVSYAVKGIYDGRFNNNNNNNNNNICLKSNIQTSSVDYAPFFNTCRGTEYCRFEQSDNW